MSEQPQFRHVLRGFAPDEVTAKIAELDLALGIARRTAAQRTTDMTRARESEAALKAQLDAAMTRLSESEGGQASLEVRYADLGPRVRSILALAEAEAAQVRADGDRYAAELRRRAKDEAHRASSRYEAQVAEAEQRANSMLADATAEAEHIIESAHLDSNAHRAESQATLAQATELRRGVARQLGQVLELLDRLEGELAEAGETTLPGSADRDGPTST